MFAFKGQSITATFSAFIVFSLLLCQISGNPLGIIPQSYDVSPDQEILEIDPFGETLIFRIGRADQKLSMLDKVNVDTYLKNKRAVNQQIKCILKDGVCDAVGKEIKRLIPYVLANSCNECSASQLEKIQKIIDHLKDNYPKDWASGKSKFGAPEDL